MESSALSKFLATPVFILGYPLLLAYLQVRWQEAREDRRSGHSKDTSSSRRAPDEALEQKRAVSADPITLRVIARDRAPTRREKRDRERELKRIQAAVGHGSSNGGSPVLVGAVVGLIAAVGYLAFRTPIQFAVLTVSGLGLGWVASVYKHLQRDGALGNDWKLLVCMLALVFGLGFVCVWQLRDPLFDQGTRYGEMLQFYDHSGFKALLDRYGFDAVMFFALQALGVLFTLMAFQIAVTHALGMLAEVADRHGRDLGYAEEWLLDRQRRAGIGPWGPAWAAVVACLFGLAFASGGIAAGVKAAKEEQQRSMRPRIERLHLIGARGAIFVRGAVEPAFPAGSAALDILVRRNQRLVRRVKRTMHKRTFAFKIRGEDGQSLNPGWYRVLINLDGTQLRNKIVRVRRAG